MANQKFYDLSKSMIELIGGKNNVANFTHCVTRLRFNVKDKGLVKEDEIGRLDGVAGTQWFGEQFQVIVGTQVDDIYAAMCKVGGFDAEAAINENLDAEPVKKGFSFKKIGNGILSYTAPTMTSVIPIMMAACLIRTIATVLGPTMLNVIAESSDLYLVFDFIYNAFFYFLPIFLGYTAANTLKMNPIYGIFCGTLIIVPGFLSLVGVRETISVFGIQAPVADYSNSFLPVMLGVLVMHFVLKLLKKIIPASLATVFVPTLAVLIMTPVMLIVCAPLGTYVGNLIGSFFIWLAGSNIVFSVIGAVILAALFPYIVLSGMHGALLTFALMTFFENGVETYLLPIMLAYNFAVFGVAFGAFLKLKKPANKSAALSYFVTGILGSITEPALYGVVLKYKSAMKSLLIVCAAIGLFVGVFQPGYYAMASASVFTFWTPWPAGGTGNMVLGLILMLGSIFGGAVAAFFGKYQED